MMATAPTRELADRAFKTILSKWSRDEWKIDGVERGRDRPRRQH